VIRVIRVKRMFERFNESARRTLFFSRYEASEFGSLSIGTEHMLMGIIREARGVVADILTPDGMASIRHEIRRRVKARDKVATSVEIPFSEETKRALQYATEEADRLLHAYIGSEHLLLGLMREDTTLAGSVLRDRGFRLPTVREGIVSLLEKAPVGATERDEIHERIEHIKLLVQDLGDEEQTSANREFQIRQIVSALEDLARRWGGPTGS
jgi:ATP-dependent Clp protease ATP-binding subunit ClpC